LRRTLAELSKKRLVFVVQGTNSKPEHRTKRHQNSSFWSAPLSLQHLDTGVGFVDGFDRNESRNAKPRIFAFRSWFFNRVCHLGHRDFYIVEMNMRTDILPALSFQA
jgi:hypothetical protein